MRRLSAVFLAAALTLTAACSGGDKDSGGSDGPARKLFQPAGVVGPDSFAPTFAVATYDVDPSTLTNGDVSGSAPGLYAGRTYGGTGSNICDVEAMIRFLTYYEDRGRAWAAIQGIAFEELESYLRSLTPVFALQNLNVQMFGFKNGQSYGYDAVIAAGTAILVDDEGMPRARCACGNPLLGPSDDAPEGTDIPPTTDEGNPETQDSVPEDSVPGDSVPNDSVPEDSVPEDSVPEDSVPEDSVPEDSVPEISIPEDPECPEEVQGMRYTDANGVEWIWTGDAPEEQGTAMWFDEATGEMKATTDLDPAFEECDGPDQPRTQEEPECPDWTADPVRYTDPSGMVWEYDRVTNTWFSTTDADQFKVATEDLPGYLELCDEPEQRQPGGDCPQVIEIGWEPPFYVDDNGDLWYADWEAGGWVNENTGDVAQLEDIPGYLERCTDPPGTFQPECPEPFSGMAAMDWTPYLASDGDLWIYNWTLDQWENQNTGEIVAGYDPSSIPGYIEDCGEPPLEDDPCPPLQPMVGDSWTDSETGETWIYSIRPGRDGQPTDLVWRKVTTGEERTASELYSEECGDPGISVKTVCPPVKPAIGDVWIDSTGEKWIFAAGTGGADGWDQVSTADIENLTYGELPNKPSGCPEPRRPLDCPPILDVPEGYIWFGQDGNIYRYVASEGGWVNESDPSGQVIAYTVLLPGYRKICLPPCPPLNVLETKTHAVWVDPSNGDRWIKTAYSSVWVNQTTGETLARTQDLPFYSEDCLPPCDPAAEGGKTYVINDDGLPETNEAFEDQYGESADKAVTVVADAAGVNPQQIIEQLLDAVTAIGDDCNPNGCVEPNTEPELGHSFRDVRGVLWRYVGDGNWQAENGDFVTYILDIPGYVEACLPPDVPVDRECPPEFKGSEYTDSNGIVWTWVGSHSTPADSDHGQYWYYRYEDGSEEYRYTFQLESFFDDCPRPDDVEIQESGIYVTLRVPKKVCVGEVVQIAMTVIIPPDTEISEAKIYVDGNDLETVEAGAGLYIAQFTAEEVGTVDVKGVAKNGDGVETSSSVAVDIVECGDGAGQGGPVSPDASTPDDTVSEDSTPATPTPGNTPPVVTVSVTPECIEVESGTQKTYTVLVTAEDLDGDAMEVRLNNGILGSWTITGSGSKSTLLTASDRNRGTSLTFTATADDGRSTSTSNDATLRVEYPGGCNPTQTTAGNTPPSMGVSVSKPNPIVACAGQTVSMTVTYSATDSDGDALTGTLAAQAETLAGAVTGDFSASQNVSTPAGGANGSKSFNVPITQGMLGDWIRVTLTLDDGTVSNYGTSRVEVKAGANCQGSVTGGSTTTTTTTAAPKSSSSVVSQNTPGNVSLTTKCIQLDAQGSGTVSFTVTDADGLKSVSLSPTNFTLKGSLTTGQYTASAFTKADAGKTLSISVVDGKGVSGSYKLIVPAVCG